MYQTIFKCVTSKKGLNHCFECIVKPNKQCVHTFYSHVNIAGPKPHATHSASSEPGSPTAWLQDISHVTPMHTSLYFTFNSNFTCHFNTHDTLTDTQYPACLQHCWLFVHFILFHTIVNWMFKFIHYVDCWLLLFCLSV